MLTRMTDRRHPSAFRAFAFTMGLAFAAPLAAAEKSPSASGLPGVDGGYRIVKPAPPEPEPDDAAPAHDRHGAWDITISGKWTVDIGMGDLPPPRD